MELYSELTRNEGWKRLLTLLPERWIDMAYDLGAMSFSRKFDPQSLLRVSLMYVADHGSQRIASASAKLGGLVSASPIAFHKRFRKSGPWLKWLAEQVMQRNLAAVDDSTSLLGRRIRIVDATTIQPPGALNSGYRLHYSLLYPHNLCCEFLVTTEATGESFSNFSVQPLDLLIADRIYGHPANVAYVVDRQGDVLVRINRLNLPLWDANGQKIDLLARLKGLHRGRVREFPAFVRYNHRAIPGRVCALRVSKESAQKAKARVVKRAQRWGHKLQPETLEAQEYMMLFTTLSEMELSGRQVISLYRFRWPVEMEFKRAKSLMGLDDLPAKGEDTAMAWIHGKLLLTFLVQSMALDPGSFSPWRRNLASGAQSVTLAGGCNSA